MPSAERLGYRASSVTRPRGIISRLRRTGRLFADAALDPRTMENTGSPTPIRLSRLSSTADVEFEKSGPQRRVPYLRTACRPLTFNRLEISHRCRYLRYILPDLRGATVNGRPDKSLPDYSEAPGFLIVGIYRVLLSRYRFSYISTALFIKFGQAFFIRYYYIPLVLTDIEINAPV